MRKFILIISIVTILTIGVAYGLLTTVLQAYYIHALPVALFVVVSITSIAFFFLKKAVDDQNQNRFNRLFLSVTSLKLMFYLFGLVIYILFQPHTAKIFLISFLVLYLVYTSVLVAGVLMYQKELKINKY